MLAVSVDAEIAQSNADLEAVVLTADSLDEIKCTHSCYFLTLAEPVRAELDRNPVPDAREGRPNDALRACSAVLRPLQPALMRKEHPSHQQSESSR